MTLTTMLANPFARSNGIAMMDVLVSLVLMSITLVGAFSASNAGIQELRFLNRTTTAMEASQEMAAQIANNISPLTREIYELDTNQPLHDLQNCIEGCTSEDLAKNDVYLWTQKILEAIPSARLKIVFADDTAIMGILWNEPRKQDGNVSLCPFKEINNKQYCLAFEIAAKMANNHD